MDYKLCPHFIHLFVLVYEVYLTEAHLSKMVDSQEIVLCLSRVQTRSHWPNKLGFSVAWADGKCDCFSVVIIDTCFGFLVSTDAVNPALDLLLGLGQCDRETSRRCKTELKCCLECDAMGRYLPQRRNKACHHWRSSQCREVRGSCNQWQSHNSTACD